MKFKIPSLLYTIATAIILIYLVFSFVLWFPTPVEMNRGTSVGAPAGAIVGIFLFPFFALFYMITVGLVAFGALKLYYYLDKEYSDTDVDIFSMKGASQIFLFVVVVFTFFSYLTETIVIEGRMNSLKTYFMGVKYRAQRGGFFCSEWNMWSGTHHKSKYYKYYPDIQNNEHYIEVPITKFFFSFCDYEIEKIEMVIDYDKAVLFKKSDSLVYINPPYKKQIKFIKSENNIYTVDIGVVHPIR